MRHTNRLTRHSTLALFVGTILCFAGCDGSNGPGGPGGMGSGSLTIEGETWEFDVFHCAEGADTGNANVTFSLNGEGEGDIHVSVTRQLGFSGTGTERDPEAEPVDTISLYVGNPADPDVGWHASGGSLTVYDSFLEFDGNSVYATAQFGDTTGASGTDTSEGVFEATCP
jgi:hypothetical protein